MACGQIELEFYDLKAKKRFKTANYKVVNKGNRKFAVAASPYTEASYWRAMKK